MKDVEIKYGSGYVILNYGDSGKAIKVSVEKKNSLAGAWRPAAIKDIAKLAAGLR